MQDFTIRIFVQSSITKSHTMATHITSKILAPILLFQPMRNSIVKLDSSISITCTELSLAINFEFVMPNEPLMVERLEVYYSALHTLFWLR